MAISRPPLWLQQGSYNAQDYRRFLDGLFANAGVVSATEMAVTQTSSPSMSIEVSAGHAFVAGTTVANQGYYHVFNDGVVTLSLSPADGTNSRIDRVILRVYDADISGATNLGAIEIVTGTPSGSPTAPTLPANSIELARVTVAAAATSVSNANISTANRALAAFNPDLNRYTVVSTTQPEHRAGLQWYNPSTNRFYISNGSTWGHWFMRGQSQVHPVDATYPKTTTAASTAEVVNNRVTVPSATFDRIVDVSATIHLTYSQTANYEALLYVGSTAYDRHFKQEPTAETIQKFDLGCTYALPAGSSSVVEVRFVRKSGTGIITPVTPVSDYSRLYVSSKPA